MDGGMLGQVRPPQSIFKASKQKLGELGQKVPFNDGRVYVYCKAGEGLTVGQQLQAPLVTGDDMNITIQTAGKSDDRELKLWIGAAHVSFAANAYEDGWLLIEAGTEKGLMRKIKSHGSHTTGTAATVTFKLKDKLGVVVAAVSAHRTFILASSYNGVMINNATNGITSTDGKQIGAAVVDVPIAYYFWAIVHGMGPAISDGTGVITCGEAVTRDGPAVVQRAATGGHPTIGFAASYCVAETRCLMVYYTVE